MFVLLVATTTPPPRQPHVFHPVEKVDLEVRYWAIEVRSSSGQEHQTFHKLSISSTSRLEHQTLQEHLNLRLAKHLVENYPKVKILSSELSL